jgi:hypothetical protein
MRKRVSAHAGGVAVLLLLALAAGMVGAYVHTDDGCAVEQHCRACRLAVASLADHVPTGAHAPAPARLDEPVPGSAERARVPAAVSRDSNRGPPAA